MDAFVEAMKKPIRSPTPVSCETLTFDAKRTCWYCGAGAMQALPPAFDRQTAVICRTCGFIQLRENDPREENRVPPVVNRKPFANIALQASRNAQYLRIVAQHVDMQAVRSCIDIGCDQGMLSDIIHAYYPAIRNFGIDPNPDAIAYGRQMYPQINLETAALEDYDPKGAKFDLILLTGGFYRIKKPMDALARLHGWLNDDGILVVILNISLDDASRAMRPGINCMEDLFRGGGSRLLLNLDLFKEMVAPYFEIRHFAWHTNVSYWSDRKSPFFILKKKSKANIRECRGAFRPAHNYYEDNKARYLNYVYRQSLQYLIKAVNGTVKSAAIAGLSPEAQIVADLLLEAGIAVDHFMHPLAHRHKTYQYRRIPVTFVDYDRLKEKVDALFIADIENAVGYFNMIKTTYFELQTYPVYVAQPAGESGIDRLFFTYENRTFLHQPLLFERILSF